MGYEYLDVYCWFLNCIWFDVSFLGWIRPEFVDFALGLGIGCMFVGSVDEWAIVLCKMVSVVVVFVSVGMSKRGRPYKSQPTQSEGENAAPF